MTNNDKTVAVIGDLTALYSARSLYRKQINYERLDQALKQQLGVDKFDVSLWYTLFSGKNEAQGSFVQGLKDMGWEIETVEPRDALKRRRHDDQNDDRPELTYRFDARIAYQIGLAVGEHSKLLVVSDSFELLGALQELNADDKDIEINLAFFSEAMDGRWWRTLNNRNGFIRFIDLDSELYEY